MCDRQMCRCAVGLGLFLLIPAVTFASAHYRVTGGQPIFNFQLNPANPTELDIISFFDPSAGGGSNACTASLQNGIPSGPFKIGNVIQVSYAQVDPGLNCTEVFLPVAGVEGTFGPLAPGDYIFRQHNDTDRPFTVSAVPEPGTLALLALVGLAGMRRPTACRRA